jgi:hypothetical protein
VITISILDESFKLKLKWQVYNKNFEQIKRFEYSAFSFKFNIATQDLQEEFVEFLCKEDESKDIMPWEICNFFLKRNIKYSLSFKYMKKAGLQLNYTLFKTVLFLKIHRNKFIYENR